MGLLLLTFIAGYCVALWQFRYDWLRNLALRAEIIGMRNKVYPVKPLQGRRRIPNMPLWGKAFHGFLWRFFPEAVKYNQFHKSTLKNWSQKFTSPSTYIALLKKWANRQKHKKDIKNKKRGRPKVQKYIVELILSMKHENPGYSPSFIARLMYSQLREYIHRDTVQKILKEHGYPPNPPHKIPILCCEPRWKSLINNQFVCAMDFKSIIDIMGNQLFILNIIHHSRRVLIRSVATYNPSSAWVAQQIREAFPYDTAPKFMIMDRDTIFLPLIYQTLPNMGIKPLRTDYQTPWQNCVVERFHLTLQSELLAYIVPINADHMNRLLVKYKDYYNNARPHMTNHDQPPIMKPVKLPKAEKSVSNVESVSWVGGFHHSYRWAA